MGTETGRQKEEGKRKKRGGVGAGMLWQKRAGGGKPHAGDDAIAVGAASHESCEIII
jgi:hypothetical protein